MMKPTGSNGNQTNLEWRKDRRATIDISYIIEMAAAIAGGREELMKRPVLCV